MKFFSLSKKNKRVDLNNLLKEVSEEVKKRLKESGYKISGFDDKALIKIWKILSTSTVISDKVYCNNPQLKRFIRFNSVSLKHLNLDKCNKSSSSSSLKRRSTISRRSSSRKSSKSSLRRKSTLSRRSSSRKSSKSSLRRKSTLSRKSI